MENTLRRESGRPFVLSFVSVCSGCGKTTLIEKLISLLSRRGCRVGALKHDAHRFEMDREGKDSYRFAQAGAEQVIVASAEKLGMVKAFRKEPELGAILALFEGMDLILIEGFRDNPYPKIEVHRKGVGSGLLCTLPGRSCRNLIAVASDEALDAPVPVLDLNDAEGIAERIERAAGFRGRAQ